MDATPYEAHKSFVIGGVQYVPGDDFSGEGLSEYKIRQFLNQRLIRPKLTQPQQQ